MKVWPIEHEPGCFWVSSEHGHEPYRVDMAYREEPWRKPKATCGCPDMFAKDKPTCKHLRRVAERLLDSLLP